MGLDGCGKCMKYTMIIANFVILVGGVTVMAIGIWTCVDKASFQKLMDSNLFMSAAIILIVTGIIVVIISIIGCLGALRDIKCLLLTYFVILFIIFVIMLVGGILAYVYKGEARDQLKAKMQETLRTEYKMKSDTKETWDAVQSQLKCCGTAFPGGINNVMAWQQNPEFQSNPEKVPESCCKKKDGSSEYLDKESCQKFEESQALEEKFRFTEDCYNATIHELESHSIVLGAVGISIACILILGMIFSMVLFKLIE